MREIETNLCWQNFNCNNDKSRADFRYAVYLIANGVHLENAKRQILAESDDIEKREAGRIDYYLH